MNDARPRQSGHTCVNGTSFAMELPVGQVESREQNRLDARMTICSFAGRARSKGSRCPTPCRPGDRRVRLPQRASASSKLSGAARRLRAAEPVPAAARAEPGQRIIAAVIEDRLQWLAQGLWRGEEQMDSPVFRRHIGIGTE